MGSAGRSIAALTISALAVLSIPIVLANSNPYDPARQRYRPLIGGIQIEIMTPSLRPYGICTIGYVARDRNGNLGIVTAGHCVNFRTDYVVYQPNYDNWESNRIGSPTMVDMYSDSAFIPYRDVTPSILHIVYYVTEYRGIVVPVNSTISWETIRSYCNYGSPLFYKTGRTTGTTRGYLREAYEWYEGHYRVIVTDIYAEGGDSGSPLYLMRVEGRARAG